MTAMRPHEAVSDRSNLPEVMWVRDVRLALGLETDNGARRAILRGDCGPYGRFGRRLYCRRESLIAALATREVDPRAAEPLVPVDEPPRPSWAGEIRDRVRGAR